SEKDRPVRREQRKGQPTLKKEGQSRSQCPERTSSVEDDVIPGQAPCSRRVGHKSRNDCLLKRKCSGAVCARPVQHSHEGHEQEKWQRRSQGQGKSTHGAQERKHNQRAPPPGTICHD